MPFDRAILKDNFHDTDKTSNEFFRYTTAAWYLSQDIYARHRSLGGKAITLDIFITDQGYLGKGYAVQIVNDFLHHQFPHVTEVFIDPEQRNTRTIHAYQKISFQIMDEFIAPWHPVPHYLMKLSVI